MLDHIINILIVVGLIGLGYKLFYTYWTSVIDFFGFSMIQIRVMLPVKYVDGETKKNIDRKIANIALYTFYISISLVFIIGKYDQYKHPEKYINKPRPVIVDSVEKPLSDSEKAQLLDSMKQALKYKRDY
jgi:hypothetical protein